MSASGRPEIFAARLGGRSERETLDEHTRIRAQSYHMDAAPSVVADAFGEPALLDTSRALVETHLSGALKTHTFAFLGAFQPLFRQAHVQGRYGHVLAVVEPLLIRFTVQLLQAATLRYPINSPLEVDTLCKRVEGKFTFLANVLLPRVIKNAFFATFVTQLRTAALYDGHFEYDALATCLDLLAELTLYLE